MNVKYKFEVIFLDEAKEFLETLDEKTRNKIIYNIWKARSNNDKELFKKLIGDIWEFRTLYNSTYYRLFAFWDKSKGQNTIVVATHGIIKKTSKITKIDIERTEKFRSDYFNEKD